MMARGIENWRDYWREGEQFLHTALMAYRKGKTHFTPEILYNINGMAIEKLIMAYLMKNGDLAANHTMTDLATALELHAGKQPKLTESLQYLDRFHEICDPYGLPFQTAGPHEIERILAIGEEVRDFLAPLVTA